MIESGLVGTQVGALIGSPAGKQAGAPEAADLFGPSPTKAPQRGLSSSLASVTKGSFRNSLELFTGPLTLEQEDSKLPAPAGETLAKSASAQPGSLPGNARPVSQESATPVRIAPVVAQPSPAGNQPASPGDQDGGPQAHLASGVQQRTETPAQLKPVVGQAPDLTSEARTADSSSVLKPISSHTNKLISLNSTAKLSGSDATAKASSAFTLNDGTATPPTQLTTADTTQAPIQSSTLMSAEPSTVLQEESLPGTATASLQPSESPNALPNEVTLISSSQSQPVTGKPITTKVSEAKNNKPATQAADALAATQSSPIATVIATSTQPRTVPVSGGHIAESPIAGTAASSSQTVHAVSAAHQPPATVAKPNANPPDSAPALAQTADTAAQAPLDVPASFAQSLNLQVPVASALQRPSPVAPASEPGTLAAISTHPPTGASVEASAQLATSAKQNQDKSPQFFDPLSPADTAASATASPQHSAPASSLAEPALSTTPAILHPLSTPTLIQASAPATPGSSLAHNVATSLHETSTALNYSSATEANGFAQHTTLLATPNVLEVGVASGSHGWLKVRAELDESGAVSASVMANSTSGAETMHKDLPALSAYLSSESVGVSSLVVNQAAGTGLAAAGTAVHDAAMNLGAGAGGGGPARDQQLAQSPMPPSLDDSPTEGIDIVSSRLDAGFTQPQSARLGDVLEAGSWLSVRA